MAGMKYPVCIFLFLDLVNIFVPKELRVPLSVENLYVITKSKDREGTLKLFFFTEIYL